MKTKVNKEKSVLIQLRDIRDKLSADIKDMTHEQLKEFLIQQKTLHPATKFSRQQKHSAEGK